MNKRKAILIGALAVAVIATGLGVRWWLNGEPVRMALRVKSDIAQRRWDDLYSLTVQEEREKNGWTKENFTVFAEQLTKHVEGLDLEGKFNEIALETHSDGTAPTWNLASERRFRWTVPLPMSVTKEDQSTFFLNIVKDTDGSWKAMLGPLLRDVSRSNRKDPNEHIKSMRDALTAAGLPRYYNLVGDVQLTVASLDRVLKGEIKRTEAWEKVHP